MVMILLATSDPLTSARSGHNLFAAATAAVTVELLLLLLLLESASAISTTSFPFARRCAGRRLFNNADALLTATR